MKNLCKTVLTIVAIAVSSTAFADAIEIVPLEGGHHPETLGVYEMTPFAPPSDGLHSCTKSHTGQDVCFQDHGGNSVSLPATDPWWWQYDGSPAPAHGNVFVVRNHNWIDLILPPDTRALSLFVGASDRSRAWIQAHNDSGYATSRVYFGIDSNDTRGYGIYATGCSAITRVTVEPYAWGFGYLASNEGECRSVPEPEPIALLGLGLLGILSMRRAHLVRRHA